MHNQPRFGLILKAFPPRLTGYSPEDLKRLFPNLELIYKRRVHPRYFRKLHKNYAWLAQLIYQYDTKFEETLPENVWLKKFDIVNDKLEFVNDSGDLVDEDGRKINAVGHYVDQEGKRVDKDGNPLNDDGSYVLQVEYEKEPKEPKKKAK